MPLARFWAPLLVQLAGLLLFASGCGGSSATSPEPLRRWLSFDAATKTVTVNADAGYRGINGGRNFNGYFRGEVLVSIPSGWRIAVRCSNFDSTRHSCALVSTSLGTRPAFAGASTPDPAVGVLPGRAEAFSFRPTRLGSYRLASLVAADELMGMWDVLEISRRPSVNAALVELARDFERGRGAHSDAFVLLLDPTAEPRALRFPNRFQN